MIAQNITQSDLKLTANNDRIQDLLHANGH